MTKFKVTVKGESRSISYDVEKKTKRGAIGFGKKLANEAFYGEDTEILVQPIL